MIPARMDSNQYESFWAMPDKCINEEIVFDPHPTIQGVFAFEHVEVITPGYEGVLLNGWYHCKIGAITYNFTLNGVGAISRYCAGNQVHGDGGRYHQHYIGSKSCVRRQLPRVYRRDDLRGLTAKQVWDQLCADAKITHTQIFFEPEHRCK
jgi:hypothetical protein